MFGEGWEWGEGGGGWGVRESLGAGTRSILAVGMGDGRRLVVVRDDTGPAGWCVGWRR